MPLSGFLGEHLSISCLTSQTEDLFQHSVSPFRSTQLKPLIKPSCPHHPFHLTQSSRLHTRLYLCFLNANPICRSPRSPLLRFLPPCMFHPHASSFMVHGCTDLTSVPLPSSTARLSASSAERTAALATELLMASPTAPTRTTRSIPQLPSVLAATTRTVTPATSSGTSALTALSMGFSALLAAGTLAATRYVMRQRFIVEYQVLTGALHQMTYYCEKKCGAQGAEAN